MSQTIADWLRQFIAKDAKDIQRPYIIKSIEAMPDAMGMNYAGNVFPLPHLVVLRGFDERRREIDVEDFKNLIRGAIKTNNVSLTNEFFFVSREPGFVTEWAVVVIVDRENRRVRLGHITHNEILNSPNFTVHDSGYDVRLGYSGDEDWLYADDYTEND